MRLFSLRLLPLFLLVSAACAHRPSSPLARLEQAATLGPSAGAQDQALAGHHALWVGGDADAARARFDAALEKDPDAPLAHLGHLMLAERAVAPRRQLDAALALLQRAPSHPAAAIGARQLLDLVGQVSVWDAELREALPPLLDKPLLPETRVLVHSALAELSQSAGDVAEMDRHLAALGVARQFTVVGPLSAFSILPPENDTVSTITGSGSLEGPLVGPDGAPVAPRQLTFGDGRFSLSDEPARGDAYILAADVELAQSGVYALRVASPAGYRAWVDGTELLSHRPELRTGSILASAGVRLEAGRHRVLLDLRRQGGSGAVSLTLLPVEGQSAPVWHPASGAPPRWDSPRAVALPGLHPDAAAVAAAFEKETGAGLAALVAAWDAQGRDPDGAQAQLTPLEPLLSAPAFLTLRAEVALRDRSLPSKVAQGRAMRDLERALEGDPGSAWVRLRLSTLVLEQERTADATALLAPALEGTPAYPLRLAQARIAQVLGVDAQAGAIASQVLEDQPGVCGALELRYELARKRDAVAEADDLIEGPLAACPQADSRRMTWARMRGKTDVALQALAKLAERSPTSVSLAVERARLLEAADRSGEAVALLEALRPIWPTQPQLLLQLADLHERAGDRDRALSLREEALRWHGEDLTLRRALARARTGKELLEDDAIATEDALKAYAAQNRSESTAVALVLDAAAVEAYPDGSHVSRIHTVQKVLSQGGVQEVAEVQLPPGAQVLTLRTLKPDGTVHEPEPIEGKDSISLPNVQVGDFVDVEYLLAEGPRPPSMPGFSAAGFYYQLLGQPNHWVTYKVKAPASMGLVVHGRNLDAPPKLTTEGTTRVYFHEQRDVPPLTPEPGRPQDPREYLPMVDVGAGEAGQEALLTAWTDMFLLRGTRTAAVEAFARDAIGEAKGLDAVKALHRAVHEKLTGNDAGLGMTAAASLAQDRGSRLWAMKSALEAVGFQARLVAVRPFQVAPEPSKLPDAGAVGYVGLRVTVPGEKEPVWLDTSVRFAPFGQLPEPASGVTAWVLPEPGRPLETVTTPAPRKALEKEIRLELTLDAEGELRGRGVETYRGFEGASLSDALSRVAGDRRRQGVEQALSRYFGGMRVEDLSLELVEAPGDVLEMHYTFTATRAARVEGDGLALSALTFPSQLGQRYVTVGKRELPLLIRDSERSSTHVTLQLPEGYTVADVLPPVEETSPFGSYQRTEALEGQTLTIEETLQLERGRILPADYGRFGAWAGTVDLVQGRDFRVLRARPQATAARPR